MASTIIAFMLLARLRAARAAMSLRAPAPASCPRQLLVEEVRGAPQLVGGVIALELDDAVLHLAVVEHQDHEHAVLGERHELDLA